MKLPVRSGCCAAKAVHTSMSSLLGAFAIKLGKEPILCSSQQSVSEGF